MTDAKDKRGDSSIIETLFAIVESRIDADPSVSYVARSLAKSRDKVAQKLGEEAVEAVIAATKGDKQEMISEAADLLFHLTLMCKKMDVSPVDIAKELERREGISGLQEKANRPKE